MTNAIDPIYTIVLPISPTVNFHLVRNSEGRIFVYGKPHKASVKNQRSTHNCLLLLWKNMNIPITLQVRSTENIMSYDVSLCCVKF